MDLESAAGGLWVCAAKTSRTPDDLDAAQEAEPSHTVSLWPGASMEAWLPLLYAS